MSKERNVVIKTLGEILTGRLVEESELYIWLENAAWIADTGRWHAFAAGGEPVECEPYTGRIRVTQAHIVVLAEYPGKLPVAVK